MKLHELISDAFVAEGTDTVFALMGDANMTWVDGIAAREGVRVVHARHEAAVVAMADGWSQASGRVAVGSVTCGPGTTNIVTSLRIAAHHRTPMVVLAGDTPVTSQTHLQAFDVSSLRTLAGVDVVEVRSVQTALAQVRAAFSTARRDLRPVVLSVPFDLADLEVEDPAPYVPAPAPASLGRAHPDDVAAVRERIADADRVLLLLGHGAVSSGALDLIDQLADHLDAVTGTTVKALGAMQHRVRDLGVVGGFTPQADRALVTDCDLVLSLGASLSWFTTLDGALIDRSRTVQVTDRADAWDPDYVFDPGHRVVADCRDFVERLLGDLRPDGGRPRPQPRREPLAELPSGLLDGQPAPTDGLDPVAVLATVRRSLRDPVPVVTGAGHFWNLVVEMAEPFSPVDLQMHYGFGSIGQGLPAGLGAALGSDRPTVVIEGDGSIMLHLQELDTARRAQAPLLVLIIDDSAYGAEFHKLAAHELHPQESVFDQVDFAAIAAGFGARAHTPGSLTELASIVEDFLRAPTLTVVDIRVSREVVSVRHRANYDALRAAKAATADETVAAR